MYTLVSLVSANMGIAVAPASLVNYRLPDVEVRDLKGFPPSEIAVGYLADTEHPAAKAFLRLAFDQLL
jgi:DNA-binding transcriptional LysR family regulator